MATARLWVCAAFFLLPFGAGLSGGQGFFLPLHRPQGCGGTQYFDIASLSCGQCGASQRKSSRGTSCTCLPGFKLVSDNGGSSIACEKCPESMSGVTQDGWDCITCPKGLTSEGRCKCPVNEILVERDTNGVVLADALCVPCDGKGKSFATSNTLNNMCIRCEPTFISVNKSCSCSEPNILTGGLCFRSTGNYPPKGIATVRFGKLVSHSNNHFVCMLPECLHTFNLLFIFRSN
ncbi:meckelin-like [Lacerta agilis]|uniref:meckelin-like n=1 Tax=Lacerta agilis TaxID=80427 RepID=UPI001419C228|nr:meckelin-like [Lacerta agilis]